MGKRLKARARNGRFRKNYSLEELGFDVIALGHFKRCAECKREWVPLVVSGKCPSCGSASGSVHEGTPAGRDG